MSVENNILAIEGPAPTFTVVQRAHIDSDIVFGAVSDHPHQIFEPRITKDGKVDVTGIPDDGFILAVTQLRSANVYALVERCHRSWTDHETIYLQYRDPHSMPQAVPIQYARNLRSNEGDVLILGVLVHPSVFHDAYPPLDGNI
ncbi:MAG TPA: hypothetical protein VMR81_05605 [Patescibacteria group bacterium]|nr:hypothetical protein [Patescibacteria group bacterium]